MENLEMRLKEIGNELRTKIEPIARRAYHATKAVLVAPDEEPGAVRRQIARELMAFIRAEDEEPDLES